MSSPRYTGMLPTFVALETLSVLQGRKNGASIQLDDPYFEGTIETLSALERGGVFEDRIQGLHDSLDSFDTIRVEIDSFEMATLKEASAELREVFQEMPEVRYLHAQYEGRTVVVPEWLRMDDRLSYGMRLYFFQEDEGPPATDIIHRNVDAIVNDSYSEFEKYRGELHGYPECCINTYLQRAPDSQPPEQNAVAPLASLIRDDLVGAGTTTSIHEILPEFFKTEAAHSFFAREFFPEPDCTIAQDVGKDIYNGLTDELNETLVRDYFRLNYAFCYAVTNTLLTGRGTRPPVGALGREHVYFYMPLQETLKISRYQ